MNKLFKIFELKNKLAIVSGATGYLGSVICETLAKLGSNIILIDNFSTEKKLKKTTYNFKKKYPKQSFFYYHCDFENNNNKIELIKKLKKFKKIDILINNACYNGPKNGKGYLESFKNQNLKTWKSCFEINLSTIFEITKALHPNLKKSKSASIINIASIYGVYGPDWNIYKGTNLSNPAAYAASKGGLIQLTKWMSKTMGPEIRVNAISPGGIYRKQPKKFVKAYIEKTSLNRMAVENDFIGVVTLLASSASDYITGQNIIVDGGWGS